MNTEAYVYQLKTEYAEARRIHESILWRTSLVHAPVTHAHALINVAHLDIVTGVSADIVSRTLDAAVIAFRNVQYPRGVAACDVCRADVLLREGEAAGARTEYVRLFASLRGSDDDLACYCLAKLAGPAHPVHDDAEAAHLPRVHLTRPCAEPAGVTSGTEIPRGRACVAGRGGRGAECLDGRHWMALHGWTCIRAGTNVCERSATCICSGETSLERGNSGWRRGRCLSARNRTGK
jgi:hypothetical protein